MTMPGFVPLQKFAVQSDCSVQVFVYIGTCIIHVECDKFLARVQQDEHLKSKLELTVHF